MNVFASIDSLPSVMSMLTWRCADSHRSHKDNLSVIKTSWCNVCATIPTCCTPIVPGCYIIWTALLRPDRHFSLGLCNIVCKNKNCSDNNQPTPTNKFQAAFQRHHFMSPKQEQKHLHCIALTVKFIISILIAISRRFQFSITLRFPD